MGNIKKVMIPLMAVAIVIMMFFQLTTAFRRAENSANRTWTVTMPHVEVEEGHILDELSSDLQELTVALHYEMMQQIMGVDFDPLLNLVNIFPDELRDLYEFDYGNNVEVDMDEMQAIVHPYMSSRLSDASNRLSILSSFYGVGYLAVHQDEEEIITSGHDMLEALVGDGVDRRLIHDLKQHFAHVVVVRYNSSGRWEVPFLLASETMDIIYDYLDRNDGLDLRLRRIPRMTSMGYQFDIQNIGNAPFEWKNPRDMIFVYGIPHDAFYQFTEGADLFHEVVEVDRTEERIWAAFMDIWAQVDSDRTIATWLMVGIAFLIPLAKVKGVDKRYEVIRKLPVEFITIVTFFSWILVHSNLSWIVNHIINTQSRFLLTRRIIFHYQNVRVIYFHGLLFLALCLLGYLVHYIKDIHISGWKTLKDDSFLCGVYAAVRHGLKGIEEDSFVHQLYKKFIVVDLKKGQNWRIFILVFGQVAIGLGLLIISVVIVPWDPFSMLFFFLVPLYLIVVFLYVRYKVAKVRKDYMSLFEITKKLADGNTNVDIVGSLGYFDSLKDELVIIQNGFGRAVERALSSERMKGDLITNVSHDLKTPLTSIITYVDLLKVEDLTNEKRQKYLETLELKTDRLKTLIEDLFEVSKASSGNLKLSIREVDVVTLMKQTILGLEDRINEAGIILREGYPKNAIKMELDGGRMHRVFENLIINVVKYAMSGTRAYIDIVQSDDIIKIILRNISAQEINVNAFELSERFVRGEESRTAEGSGLGLAIAKSFVELQGGTFEIEVDGDLFKVVISFERK